MSVFQRATKVPTFHRRRGAALVELALVLPILIFLVLGCVDFGRFATCYTAVTNAAREGASFGSQHPFTNGTYGIWKQRLTEAIHDEMEGIPGYSEDRLTVSEPTLIASHVDTRVRVEVSYVFEPAIRWPGLPDEMSVSRTAEMPIIR